MLVNSSLLTALLCISALISTRDIVDTPFRIVSGQLAQNKYINDEYKQCL